MKNTLIYFVRHGETDWNVQHRMQGATDIPLNEKGRSQAEAIARHLKTAHIDIIYASPLSRAQETGKTIAKHHPRAELLTNPLLIERSFGELEGKTHEEYDTFHPKLNWEVSWSYPDFRPPGGESLNDVHSRAKTVTDEIIRKHKGKTVLLVSHGVTIRLLIGAIVGTPIANLRMYEMGNASLTILELSDTHGPSFHVSNYQAEEI
jgi:broad specificity phosphatase PhoE